MKHDVVAYKKIYTILKNRIKSGLLPDGAKLPSRANLSREFGVSEKSVRWALELLAADGLVSTAQRKRPVVCGPQGAGGGVLQEVDGDAVRDLFQSGILLCCPLVQKGIALCAPEDWAVPEAMVAEMDPEQPTGFFRLYDRIWRFFIARIENELILRAVDSLSFVKMNDENSIPLQKAYYAKLLELLQAAKRGDGLGNIPFRELFTLYGSDESGKSAPPVFGVPQESLLRTGSKDFELRFRRAQERYSSVYLDIIALIVTGRYQPGDRLPSHSELRKIYGVSVDTTVKAVQTLKEWGVVTAERGKGIFVAMDLPALHEIQFDAARIASHVRRFLDTLELVSLTIADVAAHAGAFVTPEEAQQLRHELESLWTDRYLYQLSPIVLLDFLIDHIQYNALRVIYVIARKNYHVGRCIPKLVQRERTPASVHIYDQCMRAVDLLIQSDVPGFAQSAASMYQNTHRLIIKAIQHMGYWDAAMQVYDGKLLWLWH